MLKKDQPPSSAREKSCIAFKPPARQQAPDMPFLPRVIKFLQCPSLNTRCACSQRYSFDFDPESQKLKGPQVSSLLTDGEKSQETSKFSARSGLHRDQE